MGWGFGENVTALPLPRGGGQKEERGAFFYTDVAPLGLKNSDFVLAVSGFNTSMIQGNLWKFGNNVDTDQIISSQYLLLPTIDEMKGYTFESLNPAFATQFTAGEIIVGGDNFGCGSSREQAPRVLKALGASAVIARSFARIFFRNSINIGLPLIICEDLYEKVTEGDRLGISFEQGAIEHQGTTYHFPKFPPHLLKIMEKGGLIEYINSL